MNITWKIPADPPDAAAIARMRKHFTKPSEPMPEAWFIGGNISFFTKLDADSDTEYICRALQEIRGGLTSFSGSSYEDVWKGWFYYLLPDLILRANEPENFDNYSRDILNEVISICFVIYPDEITEEYLGFRDDIISTLGNCALPEQLARQLALDAEKHTRLFLDIWDIRETIANQGFYSYEAVNYSVIFCLKYLNVDEIESLATSLFQIESPQ